GQGEGDNSLYQTMLNDTNSYRYLLKLDEDLAAEARAQNAQEYKYIRYKSTGIFRPSIEESSVESSTKTKSWRSRPASPQRKRNRGGIVGRAFKENEIVEESSGDSSTKTESWRSRPASPQRKRNRGGVVG